MGPAKQIIFSIFLFLALIGLGCMGYMTIEGWNFMDALYMTIITLATVGYSEVHEVSVPGRLFTLAFILLGGGFFIYVMGNTIQFLVEGQIRLILGRRKLDTRINRLKGHYIICGYGRIGRVLTSFLTLKNIKVAVIEQNSELAATMNDDQVLYLVGEAMDENLLVRAGIHRAKGLVTAVGTDADNVFLVLTAKALNPDIFVVARASHDSAKKTLETAGADKVISPYDVGARRMAHAILRPTVIDFLEMAFTDESTDIQVEEIPVRDGSDLVGETLLNSGIRRNLDLIIIAIRKPDGSMVFNPKAATTLAAGDMVIAVGCAGNLKQLENILLG